MISSWKCHAKLFPYIVQGERNIYTLSSAQSFKEQKALLPHFLYLTYRLQGAPVTLLLHSSCAPQRALKIS